LKTRCGLLVDLYAININNTIIILTTKAQRRHTDESASQKWLTAKLRRKKAPRHVRTGERACVRGVFMEKLPMELVPRRGGGINGWGNELG
jgi:hypothetical protein